MNYPENQCKKKEQHEGRTYESLFFPDSAVNKVSMLFRHIFKFRLRAVEKSFASDAARTYGDF